MLEKKEVLSVAGGIEGWMSIDELSWLYDTASRCDFITELGSHCGRSTFALASAVRHMMFAVDLWANGVYHRLFERNLGNLINNKVYIWRGDSVAAATELPGNMDMVFIDADHKLKSVKADIEAWVPKVRPGGIICGHDYDAHWPGVMGAVDLLFDRSHTRGPGSIWIKQL